jgi:hypothetical protein
MRFLWINGKSVIVQCLCKTSYHASCHVLAKVSVWRSGGELTVCYCIISKRNVYRLEESKEHLQNHGRLYCWNWTHQYQFSP